MQSEIIKDTFSQEMYLKYNWFLKNFVPLIQEGTDEFFDKSFDVKLISLSSMMNVISKGSDFFVTKIRIDKQHEAYVRCSDEAIELILTKILGKSKEKFDLSKITQMEAEIIIGYNEYLYNKISKFIIPPEQEKRKDFSTYNIGLFIQDTRNNTNGKIIITIPTVLLNPQKIITKDEKFNKTSFKKSKIFADIKIGTTKFPLSDLKKLERGDIVIFENSNLKTMYFSYKGYEKAFRIAPNPALIMSADTSDEGESLMIEENNENLWDSIQVEMGAEFEKVKISLGELKNIEEGLVVDIASVYDNKISLKVENKVIAEGELVIINDRYGVQVNKVYADGKEIEPEAKPEQQDIVENNEIEPPVITEEEQNTNEDENFDYSDFELDDEDI